MGGWRLQGGGGQGGGGGQEGGGGGVPHSISGAAVAPRQEWLVRIGNLATLTM